MGFRWELDDDIWRATEPGTPHPRKRLEAVARLNDAGVPCGVLVAPVIPGLSDSPAQLDAVVRGCVEAGRGRAGGPAPAPEMSSRFAGRAP